MIITKTPFRVSFFGGGTDYPVWLKKNHGAVLSATIDKYCYISARYLPAFFEYKSRIVYSKAEQVDHVSEIRHPSVRACLKYMKIVEGVEIHHDGDLPARTGIGSSSSFTAGLLHALNALKGRMISKPELALDTICVEQNVIKENVGCQDQIAAAFGGFNLVTMKSSKDFRVSPVTLPAARLGDLQAHLMLCFTGLSRTASLIARKQVVATPGKERELMAMRDMAFRAVDILDGSADLALFGRLLHESWMLKRTLTDETTTPLIDRVYREALKAGAVGGKLLGAGGGGFLLLFARPSRQAAIRRRLRKYLHVPFRFEGQGSQVIVYRP